jgi:hypothetical protein
LNDNAMEQNDWPTYTDPAGRFVIRYQYDWCVLRQDPDRTIFREPGGMAEFSIQYYDGDCVEAQSAARRRRLNYYLVRTTTSQVAGHEGDILEFRDTIADRRDFRAFVPAGRGCYELQWTHSERSEGHNLKGTLDRMLSAFMTLTDQK